MRGMSQPSPNPALQDLLARLKHDLGKYVALQQRWLPATATLDERRAALRADLLETRRGPNGTQDAASVWRGFRPQLFGEAALPDGCRVDGSADPDLVALDEAMKRIDVLIAELSQDAPIGAEHMQDGFDAANAVAQACQRLTKRARNAEIQWPTS